MIPWALSCIVIGVIAWIVARKGDWIGLGLTLFLWVLLVTQRPPRRRD